MKKIEWIAYFIFALQVSLSQAAQESNIETEQTRQEIIKQAIIDFPHLVEGLDIVCNRYYKPVKYRSIYGSSHVPQYLQKPRTKETQLQELRDLARNRMGVKKLSVKQKTAQQEEHEYIDLIRRLVNHRKERINQLKSAFADLHDIFSFVECHGACSFYTYLDAYLAKNDEEPNFGELIEQAQKFIFWHAQIGCLDILNKATNEFFKNMDICTDPLFLHVREHQDGYMKNMIKEFLHEYHSEFMKLNSHIAYPLLLMLQHNHIEIVQLFFSAGFNVNTFDKNGCSLLHEAVQRDNKKMVQLLIDEGFDVNYADENKEKPLYRCHDVLIAHLLLNAGANIDIQNKKGWTPLHATAEFYRPEILQLLIARGADVNIQDEQGNSPLHLAVTTGYSSEKIVQYLLDAGADITIQNNNGFVAQQLAKLSIIT